MISIIASSAPGLSPLARGTRWHGRRRKYVHRFIPAGAGNTPGRIAGTHTIRVYPRWRGEHTWAHRWHTHDPGLSPLARGTLSHISQITFLFRFIPAGAGNTIEMSNHYFDVAVYPRWRGEHEYSPVLYSANCGLSPLARGTH